MHANFTERATVAALGGADSNATLLFDYQHSGRDQVAWVVAAAPGPGHQVRGHHHVPAAHRHQLHPVRSLPDFWLPDGAVELVAYAHSIDFGAKGYGNLVELASLQQHVAGQLGRPAGGR